MRFLQKIIHFILMGIFSIIIFAPGAMAQSFKPIEWTGLIHYYGGQYYAGPLVVGATPRPGTNFATPAGACEAATNFANKLQPSMKFTGQLSEDYETDIKYPIFKFSTQEYVPTGSFSGYRCQLRASGTSSSGNAGTIVVFGWSADAAVIITPVCPNGTVPAEIEGEMKCYDNGTGPTGPPDCEDEKGDSPKSTPPKKCAGNPIAIDSGSKQAEELDYAPADGMLAVKRKYRSKPRSINLSESLTEIPGFGTNWRGLIPGRITVLVNTSGFSSSTFRAEFLNDSGSARQFELGFNNSGEYRFASTGTPTRLKLAFVQPLSGPPLDAFSAVADANGPSDLRLSYSNGDYILFRRSGIWNQAVKTRHYVPIEHGMANGYKRWFDYSDIGQYPNRIRDSLGRSITIDWTEIGWASTKFRQYLKAPNQPTPPADMSHEKAISTLSLPDGTRMAYSYGPSSTTGFLGRLETAKRFDTANTVLWARTYLYEDPRFLTAMTGMLDQNDARLSTYAYNAKGQAVSTERVGGFARHEVAYSDGELLSAEGGPASPLDQAQYGDIRSVKNALGLSTRYTYSSIVQSNNNSELGRVLSGPNPALTPRRLFNIKNGAAASVPEQERSYQYDNNGLQFAGIDANGNQSTQENIPNEGRPSKITDASGIITQIEWHPTFDLRTSETRKNLRIEYRYSPTGQMTGITQIDIGSGASRATEMVYGEAGRIASINGPRVPDAQGRDDIATMSYDAQGNLLTATNPLGHITQFEGYDANGHPARMIDPNTIITEFAYDGLGRVKATKVKNPTDATKDAVTMMDYDVEGRIKTITQTDTAPLIFDYNLAGLLTAIRSDDGERIDYTHDPMGNILSETVKRADGTKARGVLRSFDGLGRLLTLALGPDRITQFQYDNVGNPTKITSARGNVVDQAYDSLNRVVRVLAPDGGKNDFGYEGGALLPSEDGPPPPGPQPVLAALVRAANNTLPDNQRDAFRDPNGVTTYFNRNGFGQTVEEFSPDRGTIRYEYDAAGDVKAMIDGRGQRVEYTRDILGRVVSKAPIGRPVSEKITYSYDTASITGTYAIGRLSRIDDGTGATRFAYDYRGNMVTRFQKLLGTPDWVALRYAYDLADRIETITYPSSRQVRYVRNAKGQVVGVRTRINNTVTTWTVLASNMSYEAFGALKTINYGNGERMIVARGDDGRLDGRRLYKLADGANISHLTYGYDADDNITRITDKLDVTKLLTFAYDAVGRMKRVTSATGAMQRTDYVFDANGNRIRELRRPLPTDPASAAVVDRYTLEAGTNRLAKIVTPVGNRDYSYDARGNLATENRPNGITVTTAYDGYGRLTAYAKSGEASLTHVYNGMDDRVATTSGTGTGSGTSRFVYAPDGRVLGEYGTNAQDVKAEFIWMSPQVGDAGLFGGDDGLSGYMPLAVSTPDPITSPITGPGATQLSWVHANHMGVPIRYSDASGQTLAQPTGYSVPGFPGQSKTNADLYYNRYRDYDTSTGRYIQADPIGLAGGASPYSYAMNNPLRYSDPTGEFVPAALCGIGAAVSAGATGIGQLVSGKFDGTNLLASAIVGCASGVVAPVAATTWAGAAALGGISSVAQYGLSEWANGCEPTREGVAANLAAGTLLGRLGRALPKAPNMIADYWKEPWKGFNSWMNTSHLVKDAQRTAAQSSGASGIANAFIDWFLGEE